MAQVTGQPLVMGIWTKFVCRLEWWCIKLKRTLTRHNAALVGLLALTCLCSGCFWICRVPFPRNEKFSDDGICTNRVWIAPIEDMCGKGNTNWCVYPLIGLRFYMTKHLGDEDDVPLDELRTRYPERCYNGKDIYNIKWQRRMRWLQYGVLWLGSPIDAVVDTAFLPYDVWRYCTNDSM